MYCNDRLEFRVTAQEKLALVQYVEKRGITISALLRRGMKAAMNQREPVGEIGAIEIVALRRRINLIGQRVDDWGRTDEEAERVKADLHQAHRDAQRLLGRC